MTTINFQQDLNISETNFKDVSGFMSLFINENYPDSNIENEYQVASDMKWEGLPESFVKNFVKSYG